MGAQNATKVVMTLLERGGAEVTEEERGVFEVHADIVVLPDGGISLSSSAISGERVAELGEFALKGFFLIAAEGEPFVPPARIKERFGKSLNENYPEAGPSFLRFATTYWTLKLVLEDLVLCDESARGSQRILELVEEFVRTLFFPTLGPLKIHSLRREQAQREVLSQVDAFDIDDFVVNNPILIRDRVSERSGCLGSSAIVAWCVLKLGGA